MQKQTAYSVHSLQFADRLLTDYSSLEHFIGYMTRVVEDLGKDPTILALYTDHLNSIINLRESIEQLVRHQSAKNRTNYSKHYYNIFSLCTGVHNMSEKFL